MPDRNVKEAALSFRAPVFVEQYIESLPFNKSEYLLSLVLRDMAQQGRLQVKTVVDACRRSQTKVTAA